MTVAAARRIRRRQVTAMSGLRRSASSRSCTRQPSTMVNECSSTWPFTIFVSSSRGVVPGSISYSPALTAGAKPFQARIQDPGSGLSDDTLRCQVGGDVRETRARGHLEAQRRRQLQRRIETADALRPASWPRLRPAATQPAKQLCGSKSAENERTVGATEPK